MICRAYCRRDLILIEPSNAAGSTGLCSARSCARTTGNAEVIPADPIGVITVAAGTTIADRARTDPYKLVYAYTALTEGDWR
jgi:hypothetical protein